MKVLIFTLLLLSVENSYGCMATGGGGGGEVEPTTCPAIDGQVLMFQQNDHELQPEVWGAVDPTSTCEECADGADRYWPSTSSEVPQEELGEAAGSINTNNCPDLCVCDEAGICYTWTGQDPDIALTFWPFCDGADCAMYGVLTTVSDTAGLTPVTGGTTFTAGDQLTVTNGEIGFKPVSDPAYPRITSVGCSGCDGNPTTCLQ